ncbi:hypothetical protein [Hyunsoonleella ulvae]|uniref:hypothetical protein n=1 Tax=Hyunsoonleella ulvae TaxID=2799948 RepID=UPI001939FD17|nr:hypothetical protein [Hyunsoonleella ulvae]
MKKTILILTGICFIFFSCQIEKLSSEEETLTTTENELTDKNKRIKEPKVIKECKVVDLDRCDLTGYTANFWWPEQNGNWTQGLFHSDENNNLYFKEYDNGTAHISGSTILGDCIVSVDVWLNNRLDWEAFSSVENGGSFKDEENDCTDVDPTSLHYYVIDSSRSTITATGGDCYQEGTFGVEQRPDPNDDSTPHFGVIVGPGAGLFDDSDINAYGLSTWGWLTDLATGERLYIIDFNFNLECEEDCDTAYAIGNTLSGEGDDSTCFIEDGFSRWGWTIGPLSEGEYTYDFYAGAAHCDTGKGELVGTVTVNYSAGNVSVTYNIDEDYYENETHTYAGKYAYPTKNGENTVAPGQYTITPNLSGEIYIIAHAEVCKK